MFNHEESTALLDSTMAVLEGELAEATPQSSLGVIDRWLEQLHKTENATDINNTDGIGEIRRFDNGKGIASIQPMHGNLLQVENGYYSLKNPRTVVTDKEISTLSDIFSQGHALVCGDFLGIGRDQIVAGWRNPNADKKVGIRLFDPQQNDNFHGYPIDDSVRMACEDLQAADLDGDGDLDLIASGRATLNVLIYWNQRK